MFEATSRDSFERVLLWRRDQRRIMGEAFPQILIGNKVLHFLSSPFSFLSSVLSSTFFLLISLFVNIRSFIARTPSSSPHSTLLLRHSPLLLSLPYLIDGGAGEGSPTIEYITHDEPQGPLGRRSNETFHCPPPTSLPLSSFPLTC